MPAGSHADPAPMMIRSYWFIEIIQLYNEIKSHYMQVFRKCKYFLRWSIVGRLSGMSISIGLDDIVDPSGIFYGSGA